MNRKSFLAELSNLLTFLEKEDRQRAVRRYERAFEKAGPDGEADLIAQYGSPVRQVLRLEKEYNTALKNGEIPFEDIEESVRDPLPASGGMNGAETSLENLGDIVSGLYGEDAAAEPEGPAEPTEIVVPPEQKDGPLFGGEEEVEPETAPAVVPEPSEEAVPSEGPAFVVEDAAREKETGASEDAPEEPSGHEPEDDDADEADYSDADEEDEDDAPEEKPEGPGAGRVFGAVVVTLPMLVYWILGFVLSLALGAAFIALGAAACAAGVYLAGYVFGGKLGFMPDLLLTAGAALALFALTLLFIWTGIWIIVGGCAGVIRTSRRIYGKILKKRTEVEEDE